MLPRFRKRRIPAILMERLRIAAVVAAEHVLEEHVRAAVELVEEGAGLASIERLIASYARLHQLDEDEARRLAERVLATLGRNLQGTHTLAGPRSPMARLRHRLRGRVNPLFRDWVDQHTARAELAVLDIHVQHALDMVRIAGEELGRREAINTYGELMRLRPAIAEMVALRTQQALYERESGKVEPLRPERPQPYPLRVAENDR